MNPGTHFVPASGFVADATVDRTDDDIGPTVRLDLVNVSRRTGDELHDVVIHWLSREDAEQIIQVLARAVRNLPTPDDDEAVPCP